MQLLYLFDILFQDIYICNYQEMTSYINQKNIMLTKKIIQIWSKQQFLDSLMNEIKNKIENGQNQIANRKQYIFIDFIHFLSSSIMYSRETQQKLKSISSESQTRNPTTNKKVIFYTPVQKPQRNREPYHCIKKQRYDLSTVQQKLQRRQRKLHKSMYQLKQQKQHLLQSSRYHQAKQVNNQLQHLSQKRATTQLKRLNISHSIERQAITKAHKRQMSNFQKLWQRYFEGLRETEQRTLINFKVNQARDIRVVQEELVGKCRGVSVVTGELRSLEKLEKRLRKEERFDELVGVKREIKKVRNKVIKSQHEKIYSWAKKQEDLLKSYHTKKYNALINRIQQIHNDKYRQYQKQSHRLKLKYRNVLKKLDHQQKMQLNQAYQKLYGTGVKQRSFTVAI